MTAATLIAAVAVAVVPPEAGSGPHVESGSGVDRWERVSPEVNGSSRAARADALAALRAEFGAYRRAQDGGAVESGSGRTGNTARAAQGTGRGERRDRTGPSPESGSGAAEMLNEAFRRTRPLPHHPGFLEQLYGDPEAGSGILRAEVEAELEAMRAEQRRAIERPRDTDPVPGDPAGESIPPPVPLPADAADGDPEAVRVLLVGFGWLVALAVGLIGGAALAGANARRNRSGPLESRRLDLAGEIAETADALLAAADDGAAARLAACRDRLRERGGRAAVFLGDGVADAVRRLSSVDADRGAAYARLIAALQAAVRG